MHIQQQQAGTKGKFFVEKDGTIAAEMTYTQPSDQLLIIDHTEVSDQLRGQNAGLQLVSAAVEFARAHHIRILPLCPFAQAMFKKHKEFADVLRQQNE